MFDRLSTADGSKDRFIIGLGVVDVGLQPVAETLPSSSSSIIRPAVVEVKDENTSQVYQEAAGYLPGKTKILVQTGDILFPENFEAFTIGSDTVQILDEINFPFPYLSKFSTGDEPGAGVHLFLRPKGFDFRTINMQMRQHMKEFLQRTMGVFLQQKSSENEFFLTRANAVYLNLEKWTTLRPLGV